MIRERDDSFRICYRGCTGTGGKRKREILEVGEIAKLHVGEENSEVYYGSIGNSVLGRTV